MTRWSRLAPLILLGTALFAGDTSPVVVPQGPELFLIPGDTSSGNRAAIDDDGNFLALFVDVFSGAVEVRGGTAADLEAPFFIGGGARGAGLDATGGGEFAITWSQMQEDPPFFEDIFLQRYQVDGTPIGPLTPASDASAGTLGARTAVTTRSDSFLVAWEAGDIRGRILPFVGSPAPSFAINSSTAGTLAMPRLASQPDGSALVVWRSSDCAPSDPSNGCVRARHLSSAGVPSGPDFQLNSETSGQQIWPDVAATNGGFIAVWRSGDCGSECVRGRLLDGAGDPLGADFRVDEAGADFVDRPSVASRSDGSFVVTWQRSGGGDSLAFARAFDAIATPLTGEFQVNSSTSSTAYEADVAMSAAGDFVVSWSNNYELWGRHFDLRQLVFGDGFESGDTSGWSATVP